MTHRVSEPRVQGQSQTVALPFLSYSNSMNMRMIAKRAGVSSATVSRVINGSSLVKPETARLVRAILEEVNYIPNPMATTLKYGRSKTFGLIVPDIGNPFYAEFVGAFEDLLIEMDHEVLMTSVQTADKLVKSIRRMLMRQVDGAVLMASEFDTEAVEPLLLHKIPLVTIDRQAVQPGCSDVCTDYGEGFVQAVRYLRSLGHKKIGYIGGSAGIHTTTIREESFRMALQACDLVFQPQFLAAGDYRTKGGEEAVTALMSRRSRPTAVITANDLTALGAMRGLHQLGLVVAQDLSIIGLDDIQLAPSLQPALTTIRIPRERMARTCIEALTHTKQNIDQIGMQFTVPTQLIVRESTARPRKATT